MLIGLEREWSNKDVGIRTFDIVSLGGMLAAIVGLNQRVKAGELVKAEEVLDVVRPAGHVAAEVAVRDQSIYRVPSNRPAPIYETGSRSRVVSARCTGSVHLRSPGTPFPPEQCPRLRPPCSRVSCNPGKSVGAPAVDVVEVRLPDDTN